MEFLLVFLLSLFGAQADSPSKVKNIRQGPTATQTHTVVVNDFYDADRPDPNTKHGPIIIIDDTQYKPVHD